MKDALTAHQLASLLLAGPDDPVVLDGYEGGLEPCRKLVSIRVEINGDGRDYCGPHSRLYPGLYRNPDGTMAEMPETVAAIWLPSGAEAT